MAGETEEKQELSEDTKDGIVDNQEETQAETQTDGKKEDGFFKSTMNYISGKLKEKPETDGSSDETEVVEDDIPDAFSEAAEAAGWDGAAIIKHAKEGNNGKPFTDEELIEQIPHLQKQTETEEKTEKTEKIEEKKQEETTIPTDAKALEELIDKRVQEKFTKENESIRTEFNELQAERQKQKDLDTWNTANKAFDEASKTSPVFGLTAELPVFPAGELKGELIPTSPQYKARDEVFTDALAFMNYYGSNIDDAMSKALNAYKGKNLEEDTRRSVIKDLKRHEKNLSGSRTSKETKKTYTSGREEDIDAIRQLQRATGQDV